VAGAAQARRRRRAALGGALAALALAACSPRQDTASGVQLILNPDPLEPNSTYELRFDQPAVAAERVGQVAKESPLAIEPPLQGEFVWLSQRSGVFRPAEPPVLGTTYRLSLRHGLKQPNGQPLRAVLRYTLRTPSLEVVGIYPANLYSTNASARPEIRLDFNAEVNPEQARNFVVFQSPNGGTVPARLRQATTRQVAGLPDGFYWGFARPPLTWAERFQAAAPQPPAAEPPPSPPIAAQAPVPPPAAAPPPGSAAASATNAPAVLAFVAPPLPAPATGAEEVLALPPRDLARLPSVPPETPILNTLLVTPERALPVGKDWKLLVRRGLPAANAPARLWEDYEARIGDVTPMAVTRLLAHNTLRRGKWLELVFSKSLGAQVSSNNVGDWVSLSPKPADLRAEVKWNGIELWGSFQLSNRYSVVVQPSFPAVEGFTLGQRYTNQVTFEPLPPRLYFPEFSTVQLLNGSRQFPLLALNLPAAELRAKLLDRHTLVHALRGYRSYFKELDWVEPFQEVDFNLVPGKTIYQTTLQFTNLADQAEPVQLEWDKVLGGRKAGAVFLAVEHPLESGRKRARIGAEALVQLTDLGLAWKRAAAQVLAYLFSHTTGKPVPGAAIRLLTEENETLAEQTTDAQGRAWFTPPTDAQWIMAECGEDLHAAQMTKDEEIPLYHFAIPRDTESGLTNTLRVMTFSDRPVYRPGETLHFKAIVRERRQGELVVPAGLAGRLHCLDEREREFYATDVTVSALGSLAASVPLLQAPLGEYRAQLELCHQQFEQPFAVLDYRPNAFQIACQAQPVYAPGQKPLITIAAEYLHGQPVAKARVQWNIEATDLEFAPAGFDEFEFCAPPALPGLGFGPTSATLSRVEWHTLSAEGAGGAPIFRSDAELAELARQQVMTRTARRVGERWELDAAASPTLMEVGGAGQYLLEARAADASGRPVVATATFFVPNAAEEAKSESKEEPEAPELAWDYRNEAQIDLVPDQETYRAGDTATILVKAPISGEALVTVEREAVLRSYVTNLTGNAPAVFLRVNRTPGEIDGAIRAGIWRLFAMQTPSGGLAYWPGEGQPMLWGSAYGGVVLGLAMRRHLPVPEKGYDELLKYLSARLRQSASGPAKQSGKPKTVGASLSVGIQAGPTLRPLSQIPTSIYSRLAHHTIRPLLATHPTIIPILKTTRQPPN
jgi:hypothetical protein